MMITIDNFIITNYNKENGIYVIKNNNEKIINNFVITKRVDV